MRALTLISAFGTGEPAAWVEALAAIVARAKLVDDPDAIETLETVTRATADPGLPYETRQRLYEAAVLGQHHAIARLFLIASPSAQLSKELQRQLGPERPLRPTDRPLTLGERKALARTHQREQLLLLVRDPHPHVVAILLDNPHITEADVVRMAAARPAVPESLSKIGVHARWSVRHAVKRALVLNPSMPLADAIRIATTLRADELEELAGDHALPDTLRKHASDVLAQLSARARA